MIFLQGIIQFNNLRMVNFEVPHKGTKNRKSVYTSEVVNTMYTQNCIQCIHY
jgi:DNA repair protein RadC